MIDLAPLTSHSIPLFLHISYEDDNNDDDDDDDDDDECW